MKIWRTPRDLSRILGGYAYPRLGTADLENIYALHSVLGLWPLQLCIQIQALVFKYVHT